MMSIAVQNAAFLVLRAGTMLENVVTVMQSATSS